MRHALAFGILLFIPAAATAQPASIAVQLTMLFMAGLSVYSVFRIVERVITYRKASDQTISFVLGLREHLKTGSMDKALESSTRYPDSPVAKVIGAGIHAYQVGEKARRTRGPDNSLDSFPSGIKY